MKTANVYEIERALQQPITPEQRQTAAANNPIAALMAQRLDGAEGSLRTKLQTPPPPQGTVMNQYYQWPQQQPEMGLAQPGLEEMAQQYAAGGLVAFANGGLASMLPMGYAGEDDVPVFNTDGGEGYEGMRGFARGQLVLTPDMEDRMRQLRAMQGSNFELSMDVPESENDEDASYNEEDGEGPLVKEQLLSQSPMGALPGYLSQGADYLGDKLGAVKEKWGNRLGQAKEYYNRAETEHEANKKALANLISPTAKPALTPDKTAKPTQGAVKTKQAAPSKAPAVRSIPEPTPVPKAAPKSDETPASGIPGLELIPAEEQRKKEMEAARVAWDKEGPVAPAGAGSDTIVVSTPDQGTSPRQTVQKVVNSGLSADQQIAALSKYLQVDTSEAMKIKGEMEKANAHAGNLGIVAAMANAVGLGLGTYGPASHRWGTGLAGLASGLAGAEQADESRQAKLNELRMKIAENQGAGTRKATETLIKRREAEDKRQQELADKLLLGRQRGEYQKGAAEIGAGERRYGTEARLDIERQKLAREGMGGEKPMTLAQQQQALKDADAAAENHWINVLKKGSLPSTPQGIVEFNQIKNRFRQEYLNPVQTAANIGTSSSGMASPSSASRGSFVGGQFTPYQ